MTKLSLYTDGGVIVQNPSVYGGTFAYLLLADEKRITHKESGVYIPADMGTLTVTNNQMELLAVLLGLQYADERALVIGEVVSDSQITLGRVFKKWSTKNIPDWMIELKDSLSVRGIRGMWVRGHNGNKWNEICNEMCEREARNFSNQPLPF